MWFYEKTNKGIYAAFHSRIIVELTKFHFLSLFLSATDVNGMSAENSMLAITVLPKHRKNFNVVYAALEKSWGFWVLLCFLYCSWGCYVFSFWMYKQEWFSLTAILSPYLSIMKSFMGPLSSTCVTRSYPWPSGFT